MAIFFYFFDPHVLNPQAVDWLLTGDRGQHFVGWHAFRHDNWHWPIAWTTLLMAPEGITISTTDSNPLASIALKPFAGLLPATMQYVGYWFLLNVALTYLLAFAIVSRLLAGSVEGPREVRYVGVVAGAGLVTLAPYLFLRLDHDTLTAQWIVLGAIWTFIFARRLRQTGAYALLIVLAMFIHPYFVPMTLAFAGASVAQALHSARAAHASLGRASLLSIVGPPAAAYLTVMAFSVFVLGISRVRIGGADGVGRFSMDPFAWFNPMDYSLFLPGWTMGPGQYEGFQYLGAGVIVALLAAIIVFAARRAALPEPLRIALPWLGLIVMVLFVVAVSPVVTVFGRTVLDTGIQDLPLVGRALDVFRSSGRLFWPASYLVAIGAVVVLLSTRQRWATWLVVGCLALQVVDLKPLADLIRRETGHHTNEPTLASPEVWRALFKATSTITFAPGDFANLEKDRFYELMTMALPLRVSSNVMYTAHSARARTQNGASADLAELLTDTNTEGRLLVFQEAALVDRLSGGGPTVAAQGLCLLDGLVVRPAPGTRMPGGLKPWSYAGGGRKP